MLGIKFSDLTGGAVYRGQPSPGGWYKNGVLKKPVVTMNGAPLAPRFDLERMSPTGFNWGYGGSGPGQLALAILAHAAGDAVALKEWGRFEEEVIKKLDMQRPFVMSVRDVEAFLRREPIDAARLIRTGKKPAPVSFWKRLWQAGS